jgi:hypothetical protein
MAVYVGLPNTVLTATTSAATSSMIDMNAFTASGHSGGVTFVAAGLGVAETADVQFSIDGGNNWVDMYEGGAKVQLTSTNNAITLWARCPIRFNKTITVASVGVYMFHNNSSV